MKDTSLHVYTTRSLFAAVKGILADLKKKNSEIKNVLDAPCGSGSLTKFMNEDLKWNVVAADIDSSKWMYSKGTFLRHNLNQKLPMDDETFDLVVCLEGLKHFENVNFVLSEFRRVLRPNGILLVTIPNDLGLQSRLRYLFDGFVDVDWKYPMNLEGINEREFTHLKSLVSLPYLYYFMQCNGLRFSHSYSDRLRFWSVILAVCFYPFILLATSNRFLRNHPLKRELRSFRWLAGRRNIIIAEKTKVMNFSLAALTPQIMTLAAIV